MLCICTTTLVTCLAARLTPSVPSSLTPNRYGLDTTDLNNLYLGSVLGVVVFLTGIFEWMQEADAKSTMDGFKKMLPPESNVVRDGKAMKIDAVDLVCGDVITINMGDNVPADVRMLSVTNLKVSRSRPPHHLDRHRCPTPGYRLPSAPAVP